MAENLGGDGTTFDTCGVAVDRRDRCAGCGIWLGRKLVDAMFRKNRLTKMDASVHSFLHSAVKILLYVLVVIIAAGILGIPMTSFITVLASAGVAIGLALQGSLANFAGGLMILLFKPFQIGDYIETD